MLFRSGIIRVEICRLSGGLATPKCVQDGIRTTYQEICDEKQAPKDPCPVHNGGRIALSPSKPSSDGVPKPPNVHEPQGLKTIELTGKTVIGNDPYGSDLAAQRLLKLSKVGGALTSLSNNAEIPVDDGVVPNVDLPPPRPIVIPPPPNTDVKLDQPEPLKFN